MAFVFPVPCTEVKLSLIYMFADDLYSEMSF